MKLGSVTANITLSGDPDVLVQKLQAIRAAHIKSASLHVDFPRSSHVNILSVSNGSGDRARSEMGKFAHKLSEHVAQRILKTIAELEDLTK